MLKQLRRIDRIHALIRRKSTGSPKELAKRLEISERQVYNTIVLMKDLGAPVIYNLSARSYEYEHEVDWTFGFRAPQLANSKIDI